MIAVDTPEDLVRHWEKSFGILTRRLSGDPTAPGAWAAALDGAEVVVCCVDAAAAPGGEPIGVDAVAVLETPGTAGFDWVVAPGEVGPRRAARNAMAEGN